MPSSSVSPLEKIVSVLSYLSMGIFGIIFIIISYILKKNLRYFLMYNLAQSMLISILLAIFSLLIKLIIMILSFIPFINMIAVKLNLFLSKIIISLPGMSFNIIQFIVFLLILYIITGVITGRIFYVPVLTNLMNKAMKSYK